MEKNKKHICRAKIIPRDEADELSIEMSTSDAPVKLVNSDIFSDTPETTNIIGGADDEIESDSLRAYLNNTSDTESDNNSDYKKQIGEQQKPKSILKKIQFSEENDYKLIEKRKESKEEQLNRRLNRLPAEIVKNIGKELGIKPPRNKKFLSKTIVVDKVSNNKKLYQQATKLVKQHGGLWLSES